MTDKNLKLMGKAGLTPPGSAPDIPANRTDQVQRFRDLGAEAAAAGQFGAAVKAEEAAATILGHLKSSPAAAAQSAVQVAVLPPAVAEAIRQVAAPADPPARAVSVPTETAGPIISMGMQGDSDFPRFKDRGESSITPRAPKT